MEQHEQEDTTECDVCEKHISIYEAFHYNGLCQECWVEERNLEAELEDRTTTLPSWPNSWRS